MKNLRQLFKYFCLLWTLLCVATAQAGTVTYFHNDVAGTPMLATDAAGNVLWKENYLPYGWKLNNQAGSEQNKLGFADKPFDENSGLSYNGARYYDPILGRFNGIDPKGFDESNIHSSNRYAYANNNPYKFVDPDGRETHIINSSWDGGYNFFGHVALAFTNQGVYSYGTIEKYGSSTADYLNNQLSRRDVTITTLNTTPEQEKKMIDFYKKNFKQDYGKDTKYVAQSNNCANAASEALSDAGVIGKLYITDLTIPYDVQRWTSRLPGAAKQTLVKGSKAPNNFK